VVRIELNGAGQVCFYLTERPQTLEGPLHPCNTAQVHSVEIMGFRIGLLNFQRAAGDPRPLLIGGAARFGILEQIICEMPVELGQPNQEGGVRGVMGPKSPQGLEIASEGLGIIRRNGILLRGSRTRDEDFHTARPGQPDPLHEDATQGLHLPRMPFEDNVPAHCYRRVKERKTLRKTRPGARA